MPATMLEPPATPIPRPEADVHRRTIGRLRSRVSILEDLGRGRDDRIERLEGAIDALESRVRELETRG